MSIKRKKARNIPSLIWQFVVAHYLVFVIVGCVGFVGLVSIYKLYIKKPTYIYVKVKVGQGYWWASTQKPSMWYLKAIQNAQEEVDLTGKPTAKVLRVAYYPWYGSNQYDIYVTLRLSVSKVGAQGSYTYNRETIGIGGPIDLEFKNVQFSGTIIALSEKPIVPTTESKTVYLTKKYTYPWEYDAIKIGDYFNDGNGNVIEILEKAKGETNEVVLNDMGRLLSAETETYRYILLKIKMRVRQEDGQILYGDEIIVSPGRNLGFITNEFTFNDYVVSKIE
ncbi:MAG: hypothetical protein WA061_04295 [Microgenomates group bacterium]